MAKLIILFPVFFAVLLACGCATTVEHKVCIRGSCFSVEIADTPDEREAGLMYRETLGEDRGMLFIFEQDGKHAFWMKNTLIPLDMIWIDKGTRIVHIERDVKPCSDDPCPSYSSPEEALYVLEINAGISEELGFEVGDKATIYHVY
jgi:uncharacterized membrane protein (UPF0127 family)